MQPPLAFTAVHTWRRVTSVADFTVRTCTQIGLYNYAASRAISLAHHALQNVGEAREPSDGGIYLRKSPLTEITGLAPACESSERKTGTRSSIQARIGKAVVPILTSPTFESVVAVTNVTLK